MIIQIIIQIIKGMDINWAAFNDCEINSKKRKYAEIMSDDDNLEYSKKIFKKMITIPEDDSIYVVGNEIHFTSPIDKISIQKIIKLITKIVHDNEQKYRDSDKKLKIAYIVDSPGGSVTSILKFVDFISIIKSKYPFVEFTSIATGLIASAATIMCVVADKRKMTKHAHAMIHELSAGNAGKYTHLISHSGFLTNLHDALIDIYMSGCNKTRDELELLLKNETWLTAKKYLKYGFVDEIIDDSIADE